MSIREFFHRFLWHISAAAITLFVILLIGEYLVPGSVLPFVDLIDATIAIVALVILTVIVSLPRSDGAGLTG